MDLIKNLLESQTLYCQMIIGLMKKQRDKMLEETVPKNLKNFLN
jgi:hypothetical protein